EHFVHSRTSLLDIVLMAFVLLAFYFVLLDREQVTKRLASWSKRTSTTSEPTPAEATARTTPTVESTSSPQTSSSAEATVQSAPTPEATASQPRPPRPHPHLLLCGSVARVGTSGISRPASACAPDSDPP